MDLAHGLSAPRAQQWQPLHCSPFLPAHAARSRTHTPGSRRTPSSVLPLLPRKFRKGQPGGSVAEFRTSQPSGDLPEIRKGQPGRSIDAFHRHQWEESLGGEGFQPGGNLAEAPIGQTGKSSERERDDSLEGLAGRQRQPGGGECLAEIPARGKEGSFPGWFLSLAESVRSRQAEECLAETPPREKEGSFPSCFLRPEQPQEPIHFFLQNAILGTLCAAAVAFPSPSALSLPLLLPSPNPLADVSAAGSKGGAIDVSGRPFPCADVSTYYSPAQGLSGLALKDALHDIIKGHKTYSYLKVWEALKILDAADERDPAASTDVIEIYTRRAVPKPLAGDAEGWNREHLWPRSYGLVQGEPQFTDLHNLRPSDVNVNSSRGNKWYGECSQVPSAGSCIVPANREAARDTAATKLTWTPPAEVRGDIARALLYMDVRYNGQDSSFDLSLSDTPSVEKARMGLLSALLEWHRLDPPSPSERLRNDRVCTLFQHNRNPFVDRPELVALIWGPPGSPGVPATSGGLGTPGNPGVPGLPASGGPSPGVPGVPASPVGQGPSAGALAPSGAPAAGPAGTSAAPRVSFTGPLPAWVNELHYDNTGADEGEFLEIVVRPGVKPEDVTVSLYNGSDGKEGRVYNSFKLSRFTPGPPAASGFTVYSLQLPPNGIQNGPADGVAISYQSGGGEKVVQFISYEGEFVATEGPAKGFRSSEIGVSESEKSPKGSSIGLAGSGKDYLDFAWRVFEKASQGLLNLGQSLRTP